MEYIYLLKYIVYIKEFGKKKEIWIGKFSVLELNGKMNFFRNKKKQSTEIIERWIKRTEFNGFGWVKNAVSWKLKYCRFSFYFDRYSFRCVCVN